MMVIFCESLPCRYAQRGGFVGQPRHKWPRLRSHILKLLDGCSPTSNNNLILCYFLEVYLHDNHDKFIFKITDTYYLICNEYEYLKFRSKYFLNGAVAE